MTDTPHISEQVHAYLIADGWWICGVKFNKIFATGGLFGRQIKTLQMDKTGRWLERVDGWGNVERDVDLRNFPNDPAGAIAAVLK